MLFNCCLCHGPAALPGTAQFAAALCQGCTNDMPWNSDACGRCGSTLLTDSSLDANNASSCCPICQISPPALAQCLVPFRYQFPVDQMILSAKSGARPEMLRYLSYWLYSLINQRDLAPPQLLVPVPMTIESQRHRGFNQAGVIARFLSRKLRIPVRHDLVKKVRNTQQQKELNKSDRLANLQGAFRVDTKKLAQLKPMPTRIAIVDDVITTGSTLNLLAGLIQKHQPMAVEGWALARSQLDSAPCQFLPQSLPSNA